MDSIYNYTITDLEILMTNTNNEKFRATQVFEGVYKKRVTSFSSISNLKKELITLLNEKFTFGKLKILEKLISTDGTIKYLFQLEDENIIETVLMKNAYGYSICVSSQIGCSMGCKFCMSGMLKKVRNLSVSELVLQLITIEEDLRDEFGITPFDRIRSVVIMGIGEPFDNYNNILKFIEIINHNKGFEIGARHITLSTVGLPQKIIEFSNFKYQVNLALSLHFTTDELRNMYMPISRKYPIKKIFEALDIYYSNTHRRITFEYLLLKDVNDSITDMKNLIKLVKGMNAYVNFINYNDTDSEFKKSENLKTCMDILMKAGIDVTCRKSLGGDIKAACGQLRSKHAR